MQGNTETGQGESNKIRANIVKAIKLRVNRWNGPNVGGIYISLIAVVSRSV